MTNDNNMTGAELQTMREACHLSRDDLAGLVGVQARTVKHWENGRSGVPADVAEMVARLDAMATRAAAQALEDWRALGLAIDLVLIRYRNAADMPIKMRKDYDGLGAWIQPAIVARMRAAALAQGVRVRVIWMAPDEYNNWRAGRVLDDDSARACWAFGALLQQAMPHRADQPPG